MSDTDLIVPVELHALVANRKVRSDQQGFMRWTPSFTLMLHEHFKTSGEPEPYNYRAVHDDPRFEGVHLQWQLPEALTTGIIDPETGESAFPLVPNRWLVVRYAQAGSEDDDGGTPKVAGWVVHSDYLESQRPSAEPVFDGSNSYLNPYATAAQSDRIGRAHDLADGGWSEPETARPLFLTAIGAGLPAFAAFAPYHENVFLFHDTLQDLREQHDNYPPDSTLSYAVIGWYSDDNADILNQAADIPGLLPPDADPGNVADILAALGWVAPDEMPSTIVRTRYAGTALGIDWQREGGFPDTDRPDGTSVKVALGHSTGDAAAALVAQQTRSPRSGDLIKALFHGNLDHLDTADGPVDLEEVTHRSWFSGSDGGYAWRVVNRPNEGTDEQSPQLPQPAWLDELNNHQAAHDTALAKLARAQWRLWSLWWLRDLPADQRPYGFQFDAPAWNAEIDTLSQNVRTLHEEVERHRAATPYAQDPEALPEAIDAYATAKGLPDTQELKRTPQPSYYRPADPVIVMEGSGTTQPLGRDDTDPLPCRLPSALLTKVRIGTTDVTPEAEPHVPDLAGLPDLCKPLIAEMAMLDQAARTPDGNESALHAIVADPATFTEGPFPEYTRVWRQPWLPMYLQWEIKYCATPFHTDGTDHWTFTKDEHSNKDLYQWNETGVPEEPGAEGNVRWTVFKGRSFLTPALPYVLREQTARKLATAPADLAGQLRAVRDDFATMDLLSQTLDGFNDWLLQHDGTAQVTTDPRILDLAGPTSHVPDGAGDRRQQRFQPVRAGQFYFTDLRIIDRFGQVMRRVSANQSQPVHFDPIRSDSVTPNRPPFPQAPGPQRFIQLPPRLLQETRIRLEPVHHSDDRPLAAVSTAPDPALDTPVAGWLLVNHLDQTLLVYAPDGSPLGELRVIHTTGGTKATRWNPLPHSPYHHPTDQDFTAAYPHTAHFATGLLAHGPDTFTALMTTIDDALAGIADPNPAEDRTAARLIGRPVALIRARLGLELQGPPLTDPCWDQALDPRTEDYPDYAWPVRLGEPDQLADGLIGYFTSDPGQPTSYDRLFTPTPPVGNPYFAPIGNGARIAMPARPADSPLTRYLTLLACPHTAVHATTDILPVADLSVDADTTHRAMAAIRASFRLNPLLAPVRTPGETDAPDPAEPAEDGIFMPRPSALHGTWTWAQPLVSGDGPLIWTELPILPADDLTHPDDPIPTARAGYLQLRPAQRGEGENQ
ncbi:hypothetical protein OG528_29005 [Streptomyces platensis]|uniref:hypothetical protein n=1 Tax=Streptomyces platensis TaxID=58346 RepID=UPI0030DE0AA7